MASIIVAVDVRAGGVGDSLALEVIDNQGPKANLLSDVIETYPD
jgi:hypothetical protein